jgi:hypothetical protein
MQETPISEALQHVQPALDCRYICKRKPLVPFVRCTNKEEEQFEELKIHSLYAEQAASEDLATQRKDIAALSSLMTGQ